MNEVAINISWEYFLGIMGALLGIAWYSNGRFTKLETSMGWVKEMLKELKTASDNETAKAFESSSPVNLNQKGEKWLTEAFAFAQGTTMNIMRRVAAIHFRNLCLTAFGMKTEDIDQHEPGA